MEHSSQQSGQFFQRDFHQHTWNTALSSQASFTNVTFILTKDLLVLFITLYTTLCTVNKVFALNVLIHCLLFVCSMLKNTCVEDVLFPPPIPF